VDPSLTVAKPETADVEDSFYTKINGGDETVVLFNNFTDNGDTLGSISAGNIRADMPIVNMLPYASNYLSRWPYASVKVTAEKSGTYQILVNAGVNTGTKSAQLGMLVDGTAYSVPFEKVSPTKMKTAVNLTAGETFVAEVSARKLGSPMDSKLVLRDSTGKIVAENDDAPRVLAGTVLHQADSRITYKAGSAGVYTVEISDNAGRGGDMYRYWLRLDKPRPRFNIYAAPSGISVSAPHETPVYILVEYLDGFDGEITLVNPSKQLVWSGVNRIPRGTKESVVTLTSPAESKRLHPQRLMFYARGGKYITQVKPADRAMQAFAYTHYQPSNSFFIARSYDKNFANMFRFEENIEPDWQIVAGGKLDIKICRNGKVPAGAAVAFDLPDAPAGLKISEVKQLTDGWNVTVATAEKMKAQEFNQLLRVTLNYEVKKKDKTRKIRKQLYLPVCRFEILTEEVKK